MDKRSSFIKAVTTMYLCIESSSLITWLLTNQLTLFWISFFDFFPILFNYYLIKKGKIKWAILLLLILVNANIWIIDDGIGGSFGYCFFFFPILLAHFVLFGKNERAFNSFSLIITLFTILTTNIDGLSPNIGAKLLTPEIFTFPILKFNYVLSFGITAAMIFFIVRIQNKFENALEDIAIKANEASEMKSQFLSNMSHELRTPMNAVVGITNFLLNEKLAPEQRKHIDILKFSADNLLNVINDILDYSKIEANKIELDLQHFSLFDLSNKIVKSQEAIAQIKGIELELNFDKKIPKYMLGDSKYIVQIVNNLVSNAIKFTEKGKVKLIIKLNNAEDSEANICVSVEDTGIGIEQSKISQIFDRFIQASSDTNRKYGGTGLGLAISNRLLHIMNTRLHVESELNKGSRFWFNISLAISPMDVKVIQFIAHNHPVEFSAGIKVLLVEDNEINQLVAGNFLQRWGFEFDIAQNGAIAVQMVQEKHYDLILMDIQMPVMNGYEASSAIRNLPSLHYQKVPIIALTASAIFEIKEKMMEHGLDDCVSKPFKPEELQSTISKYFAVSQV